MSFNDSQREAIGHMEGPMLVLAGPGSGKTLVITERTKNLIVNGHVDPADILVITFTKAAAGEMKSRFQRLMGKPCPVTFGTFHAVFFGILKHAYGMNGNNIVREEQRYAFLREIIRQLQIECDDEKELISDLLGEIGILKNSGAKLEDYHPVNVSEDEFCKVYNGYQQRMQKKRLIDFDDMLVYCYELLTQRPDILAGWQARFRYILIDEFQDINNLQFEVMKLLALPENNLFVVGDDDQSIYRFRGAKPELMLGFPKSYPDAKQVLLDVNYRSLEEIVKASVRLIGHNVERFDKKIRASREGGQPPEVREFPKQSDQNMYLIQQILAYHEKGHPYQDIAILFRTNTQPRLLMEQLMAHNVPFRSKDSIPNLYEHWIAKDVLTYVRLALGSRERSDFLQIMNRPNRYISRESLEDPQVSFSSWAHFFYCQEKPWVAERIEKLDADLRVLSRLAPFAAINYLRGAIGYEKYLCEYADYRGIKADELLDVLDEMMSIAREYKTYDEWFAHIKQYGEELRRMQERQNQETDSVSLATLHSSKGLEYPIVFIVDVNEGLMPYKKAVLPAELEEERRMFYVGMTRAKDSLHLYWSDEVNGREMDPSRFLEELQAPPVRGKGSGRS